MSSSRELRADFYRRIRSGALAASQFPPVLHDRHGAIHKPAGYAREKLRSFLLELVVREHVLIA